MTDNCNHRWSEIVDLRDDDTEHYRECVDCGVTTQTGLYEDSSSSVSSTRSSTSCEVTNPSIEVSSNSDDVNQTLNDLSKSLQLSND